VTARQRVSRTRAWLALAVAIAASGWAAAAALATGVALILIARVTGNALPDGVSLLPAAAALVAAGVIVYRAWPGRSLERVALWVEEQDPSLAFALVTASDPALPTSAALERAAQFDPLEVVRRPADGLALALEHRVENGADAGAVRLDHATQATNRSPRRQAAPWLLAPGFLV